jgi:nucleoside-diphosphate-sugar epimerase
MRIVITGAAGFLGTALRCQLSGSGGEVLGVTRQSGTPLHQVARYEDAPEGDVLVHLAEDGDRARVNAQGAPAEAAMQASLHGLLQKKYARVVYASSAVLYGDQHATPRRATDAVAATDAYTRIKFASESAVLRAEGVVARLANLYGPGMSANNVLSKILTQVPGEGELVVYDTAPVRDFIWVQDAAALLASLATGTAQGIVNAGTGIGTSIHELAAIALACAGQSGRPIRASHPAGRCSNLVLDITETTRLTGWMPATTLAHGIGRLLKSVDCSYA